MLPEGWKRAKLEKLAKIERGKFSARPRNSPKFFGGNIPFIQTGDVTKSSIYLKYYVQTINQEGLSVSKIFPKGTILMTIAANIGDTAITIFDLACSDSVVGIMPEQHIVDTYWLKIFLDTQRSNLVNYAPQNAQKNINLQVLKPLEILLPPLPEQKKTAVILSTWDRAIEGTERLLANSQQQKKALMQQLLTAKRRLPGFVGEWEYLSLGKSARIIKGSQLNRSDFTLDGAFPVINGGIIPSGYTITANRRSETITISEGGNSCGYVDFQEKGFWCGGHCYSVEESSLFNKFLYQLLKLFQPKIMALRVGSGLPNIQKKSLEELRLYFPIDVNEQKAIAAVLTTADDEITAIKADLERLRREKKALMQQLLTGKRRVVVDAEVSA